MAAIKEFKKTPVATVAKVSGANGISEAVKIANEASRNAGKSVIQKQSNPSPVPALESTKQKSAVDQMWERASSTPQKTEMDDYRKRILGLQRELQAAKDSDARPEAEKMLPAWAYMMSGKDALEYLKNPEESRYADLLLAEQERKRLQDQLNSTRDEMNYRANMGKIDSMSEEQKQDLETLANSDNGFLSWMNIWDDQKALKALQNPEENEYAQRFGAEQRLKQSGIGGKQIQELSETYQREMNREDAEQAMEEARQKVKSGFGGAVSENAAAFANNLVGGITGTLETADQAVRRAMGKSIYSTADTNRPGYRLSQKAAAAREATSEQILGEDPTLMNKAANILYKGGTSAVDNVLRGLAGGGTAGSLALAGMGSFQDSYRSAAERGADDSAALLYGSVTAALEVATEFLPTEHLLGAKSAKECESLLRQAFVQAGLEIPGEEISLWGEIIADAYIMGDKSEDGRLRAELIANGYSKEKADDEIMRRHLMESAETALTTLVSSGGSVYVQGKVDSARNRLANMEARGMAANSAAQVQNLRQEGTGAEQQGREVQQREYQVVPPEEVDGLTDAQRYFRDAENGKTGNAEIENIIRQTADDLSDNMPANETAAKTEEQARLDDAMQWTIFENQRKRGEQEVYEALKAAKKEQKELQKEISRAERRLAETGKGSQARIDQLKAKLEQYRADLAEAGLVADLENTQPPYEFVNKATTQGYEAPSAESAGVQPTQNQNAGNENGNASDQAGEAAGIPVKDSAENTQNEMGDTPKTSAPVVDTQNASTNDGQQTFTQQNPGTVGAMQSQFKHEVKQSKVYGNTYQNTPYADIHDIGRAAKKADPNIDQYDVINEAESVNEAELRTETGRDRLAEHRDLMKKDGWTGADNDTAMRLLTVYRREGKKDRFLELSRKQRQMGTQAGQMVQSFAKYSREDATVAVQDAIADLDELTIDQVDSTFWKPRQEANGEQGKKDAFQKWKESITGSLLEVANDIENVEDGDKAAMKGLVRQIANLRHTTAWAGYSSDLSRRTERGLDKMDFDTLKTVAKTQLSMIPNDFRKRKIGEILKQIRVQNMLFTLTTKFKNDTGNITNGIMDAISDSFGGRMIDAVIGKWTGKRTVGNDLKYAKEYSKAARDAADVASAFVSLDIPMEVDAKYSSGRTRTWTPNTTNVFGRLMSAYEKHMKYALEVSDKFYEGGAAHVVNKSLQSLGEKSGLTQEQIQDIAQKTGERRTFKDPGASVDKSGQHKNGRMLARANVGLQKALNNIGTENIGLGDMVMPFAAVSGEVKQVGMDYTGGGLISGMKEIISIAKDVRNGKEIGPYRQRTAATNFGRGMTGVGLIAAFTAFAAAGAVKVHNDRDSEERMMNQTQGLSGAQWNLNSSLRWLEATMNGSAPEEAAKAAEWQSGDELITIDFLEPYNTQMHIGYLLSQGEDIHTAIMQGNFNSLLEMPMMQTLSDLADLQQAFTEVSDGDMDGVRDAAGQLVGTVAGSIVPNWMRKTAQVIDPYYRDTYDTNPFRKAAKEVVAATPILSAALPKKYDNLGKEQRRFDESEWMAATFDNLVTPWDTDTYKTNPVYQEIERLNAIDGINVTPPQAKRKITYTNNTGKEHENYNFSSEQYETMQRTQGNTSAKILADMVQSKDYAALTDNQKAQAVKLAYEYAREKGRGSALEDYPEMSGWMAGADGKEASVIIKKVMAGTLEKAVEDMATAWKNGWDDSGSTKTLENTYNSLQSMSLDTRESVLEQSPKAVRDYADARDAGISNQKYVDILKDKAAQERKKGGELTQVENVQRIDSITGITAKQMELLLKAEVSNKQDKAIDTVKRISHEYGISSNYARLYADLYDIAENYTSGDGKKKRTIREIARLYNISYQVAKELYEAIK